MAERDFCSEHTHIVEIISKNSQALENITKDIYDIKNNHLDHIYRRLNGIQNWLIGVLTTTLIGVVLTLIRLLIKK